ncbi:hypothetical protein FRB94_009354 [Tulasnella sp. JGI-2019a]|nr:hypothetical protein FRB94_009354 [Tulasnella sp. JGI-2019a]
MNDLTKVVIEECIKQFEELAGLRIMTVCLVDPIHTPGGTPKAITPALGPWICCHTLDDAQHKVEPDEEAMYTITTHLNTLDTLAHYTTGETGRSWQHNGAWMNYQFHSWGEELI